MGCEGCVEACELCGGTGEVVKRPTRLMGATYYQEGNLGDEELEPCPACAGGKQ